MKPLWADDLTGPEMRSPVADDPVVKSPNVDKLDAETPCADI